MAMTDAKNYFKYTSQNKRLIEEIFNQSEDLFNWNKEDGEYVLDVGCGPGDITKTLKAFLPENSKIIGGDISQAMIEFAKTSHSSDKIDFKLLDICDNNLFKQWNQNEFSKIFSFYCLQRVKDFRSAFQNMYKLLQPNGVLFCIISGHHPWTAAIKYLAQQPKYSKYSEVLLDAIKNYDYVKKLSDLLSDLGYDVLLFKNEIEVATFESRDKLIEYFESVSYLPGLMPANLVKEAMKDFANNLNEMGIEPTKEGGCSYKKLIYAAIARKP